ncbi:hypothetical protein H7849_00580 [Alloacidobacterium dinghuense]|uniref:Uncharacterized protein n=1 Tax=Alloacidobacterium dinghuense TaxID=2763107 RepID=A0A7G8BJ41_9BACT|nr:permease prefix domain 2-containing transporter [Alloacidobacterium dinghuense]QNI32561.1 hypothetical protein H7849_00580 [Alloacidobacterium dinghuense]
MASESRAARPPRIADWLISLFAVLDEAESILGDLQEEFSLKVSRFGLAFARRWYWSQTLRTVVHLASVSARTRPWLTASAVVGGFLVRKVLGPLVEPAMFALIERSQLLERHFGAYKFFASTGIDAAHLLVFLIVGFVVALVAGEVEIVATTTLAMIYAAMAVVASVYIVSSTRDSAMLWRLTWYFADSFAIVLAGVIIRTRRRYSTV